MSTVDATDTHQAEYQYEPDLNTTASVRSADTSGRLVVPSNPAH